MNKIFSYFFSSREKQRSQGQVEEKTEINQPTVISSIPSGDFLEITAATDLLHISRPTLRRYAVLGYYKAYKFGAKRTYYRRSELLQFLERGGVACGKQEGEMQKKGGGQ